MKQIILKLVTFTLLCSCNGKSAKDNIKDVSNIYGDDVLELNISLRKELHKSLYIKNWLHKFFFKTNINFKIEELKDLRNSISIFKINLEGEYPNNLKHCYSLIYLEEKNATFLVPIEYNQVYRINNEVMIGGIYSYREFEYYLIYKLNNNTLKLVLDTRKNSSHGLKIGYFKDDECLEYRPNRFIFSYNERQIVFTGKIYSYCKLDCDRDSNQIKPLKKKDIRIEYNYINSKWMYNKNSNYIFW